ncbi:MAG: RecQ family ATP-dependent DNA helicase [Peptostreptococcales bacterium]
MERYSASYTHTRRNFVFQNVEGSYVITPYFGVYCVLKNILQRGSPTKPSVFLKQELGEIELHERYDKVLRFQLLLLSLLQKNWISFEDSEWKFSLCNGNEELIQFFHLAIQDNFLWLDHLCKLIKLPLGKPKILIKTYNEDEVSDELAIDFSMCKGWSDEAELNPNIIYVRNDNDDHQDYFQVSISDPITYELIFEGEDSDFSNLLFFLKNIFGFDDFRDGQIPIIVNVLRRNDTIGILPTGTGKSLCYQFCALLQPCISFVVCPILSLMYDQKENLDRVGVTRTHYITSDITGAEKAEVLEKFLRGQYFFVWISPERFQSQAFRESLQRISKERSFGLAIIDEVHCLSEWGHDFRTSYLTLIKTIRDYCPEIKLLGLTATASQFVLNDLQKEFEIDAINIKTTTNMNREELVFHVITIDERSKYEELKLLLEEIDRKYKHSVFDLDGDATKCGLIFTLVKGTKNGCIHLAKKLTKDLEMDVKSYHGALGSLKKTTQEEYKANMYPLLVATKAFGMGVDKSNIRYTIHYGLPWSIEAFYQEAGRAGRDKEKADCYILYKPEKCSTDIIEGIFDIKTEVSNLESLCTNLENDLSSIMFLWLQSNRGIDRELEVMRWVMNFLVVKKTDLVQCTKEYPKAEVEKAIYKLRILGLIHDWTMEAWGEERGKIRVFQNDYSLQSIRNSLFTYIRRYDPEFPDQDEEERYATYFNILKDEELKPLTRYMKMLLKWNYDNIVYQRRQTIKNMKDICDHYQDSNHLKEYIGNYFRFSDKTFILDQIAYKPDEYANWFELFYEYREDGNKERIKTVITRGQAERFIPSLQRYLESYRYNTGLNFVSGMIRLICNQFHDTDGQLRLEDAFSRIDYYSEKDFDEIYKNTLDIGQGIDEENREVLGRFLMDRYPLHAIKTYKKLEDRSSLSIILEDSLKKLNRFREVIKW